MRRSVLSALVLLVLAGCASDPAPSSSASTSAPPPSVSAAPPVSDAPSPSPLPSASAGPVGTGTEDVSVERLDPAVAARQAELDPTGAVDGLGFTDGAGTNVVLLRRLENDRGGAALLADHVVYPNPRERLVLREVRDGVEECDVDMVADFVPQSLRVADSDDDDLAEVSFAYRLNCAGDVSPDDQKLLVLEGGEKHILRGAAFSPFTEYEDPLPEPSREAWPGSSYQDALQLFRQYAAG